MNIQSDNLPLLTAKLLVLWIGNKMASNRITFKLKDLSYFGLKRNGRTPRSR